MKITAEEKLMYAVMKAISDSGVPMDFKGALVLKACLMEVGYGDDIRHTMDIDANWRLDVAPTAEQMEQSLMNALHRSGIDLIVKLRRMYGEKRSAGFELIDPETEEVLFTMDIDVNRPDRPTKMYEVAGLRFRGLTPTQMLADKIAAISGDKVFRRVKDVVDIYYLSQIVALDPEAIVRAVENAGRTLGNFDAFLRRSDELRHAYEKFRFTADVDKPVFDAVYSAVRQYINPILTYENTQ